jgi:hypothetical protein
MNVFDEIPELTDYFNRKNSKIKRIDGKYGCDGCYNKAFDENFNIYYCKSHPVAFILENFVFYTHRIINEDIEKHCPIPERWKK